MDFANWTVTVLSDDEIGDVGEVWIIWFVVSGTIDKCDDVGILFDRTRFAQV